jgi:hypothetical protein
MMTNSGPTRVIVVPTSTVDAPDLDLNSTTRAQYIARKFTAGIKTFGKVERMIHALCHLHYKFN